MNVLSYLMMIPIFLSYLESTYVILFIYNVWFIWLCVVSYNRIFHLWQHMSIIVATYNKIFHMLQHMTIVLPHDTEYCIFFATYVNYILSLNTKYCICGNLCHLCVRSYNIKLHLSQHMSIIYYTKMNLYQHIFKKYLHTMWWYHYCHWKNFQEKEL